MNSNYQAPFHMCNYENRNNKPIRFKLVKHFRNYSLWEYMSKAGNLQKVTFNPGIDPNLYKLILEPNGFTSLLTLEEMYKLEPIRKASFRKHVYGG